MSETVPEVKAAAVPLARSEKKRNSLKAKQTQLAWLLLLPTLAIVAAVALYPLIQAVYQSLTNAHFNSSTPTRFIGLRNYTDLLQDTQFRSSIWIAIKFAIVTVIFESMLGMIVALVVNSNFRGRGLTRAAMLIPWAIITVVSAQMWKFMFSQTSGVFNDILVRLHIISNPVAFLAQNNTAFWSICAIDIWKTTPFVALLLLAGLQVIPGDVYEASHVDGASALQTFWRITLPLLRPAIAVTLIFRTLDALRVFDLFYVAEGTRPDTETMAIYNYDNLVSFGQFGYGSAISVAIFVIIALFVITYVSLIKVEQS